MSKIHYRTVWRNSFKCPGLTKNNNKSLKEIVENFRKCEVRNEVFPPVLQKQTIKPSLQKRQTKCASLISGELKACVVSRWSSR